MLTESEFAALTSVEKILAWMKANDLPMQQLDLIAQDEFCHDMLVPFHDQWIAFGLT